VMDLDGPIFLAQDRTPSMTYHNGSAWSDENVWGGTRA
jgi:L-Ala-D/L-Glu epimerase